MKKSYINVRFEHTEKSEDHNFRADKTQSLLVKNIEKYKFLNILNIFSYEKEKIYKKEFGTAKDLKKYDASGKKLLDDELKNYRQLKTEIRKEHEEFYYKENKSKLKTKSKSFQEGVITFSTDILFKFQTDENIKIEIENKKYNLNELEKLFAETEAQFLKLQRKNKNIDKKENLDNVNIIEELRLEKLLEDINDSIKYNFNIQEFNKKGLSAVQKIAKEYNLRILYTTLHLDEKTPHFHFEFENFHRDQNGKIKNKGQAVFKKINRYLTKEKLENNKDLKKYYIKNVGTKVQDLVAEVYKDENILRGVKKEKRIDNSHLHITKKEFWTNEIKHKENLNNTLKEQNNKLQNENLNLTYQNVDIEASNKQELAKYKEILTQEKKDAEIAHKQELATLQQIQTDLTNAINELKVERKKITADIEKDKEQKKKEYAEISELQAQARQLKTEIREVKSFKNDNKNISNQVKQILDKNTTLKIIDKEAAHKDFIKLIHKYNDFETKYTQMLNLNNKNKELEAQIAEKDKEIEAKDKEIKRLKIIQDRAISLENSYEELENKMKETHKTKIEEKDKEIEAKNTEIEKLKIQHEQDKQDYLNYISTLNNKKIIEIKSDFLFYKNNIILDEIQNVKIESPDFSKYEDKKIEYETVLDDNGNIVTRTKQT